MDHLPFISWYPDPFGAYRLTTRSRSQSPSPTWVKAQNAWIPWTCFTWPPKNPKQIIPNLIPRVDVPFGKIREVNQRPRNILSQSSIPQVQVDFQIISEHGKINIPSQPGFDTIDIEPSGFFRQRKGSNTTRLIEMKSAKIRMPLRLKKASFFCNMPLQIRFPHWLIYQWEWTNHLLRSKSNNPIPLILIIPLALAGSKYTDWFQV